MLDVKFIRANPERVRLAASQKNVDVPVDRLLEADALRRQRLQEVEAMKARRNAVSEEIGRLRQAGADAGARIVEMRGLGDRIKAADEELKALGEEIEGLIHWIPNLPHESVPVGGDSGGNVEVRRWGEPRRPGFELKPHWELGPALDILDFERASKIAGARYPLYRGPGALLERALINFMLDLHTREHGYTEVFPPFVANARSMFSTGQLPKFEADMFRVAGGDQYLVPTAEVPLTNLHRDEILPGGSLPLLYTAYTACFRAEAGSAGRDTRGLIRNHQFNKVELVKFTEPDGSYDELESLTRDAEDVLKRLGLPYRVVVLCTGDMTFSSAKTYDIEVWLPSYGDYKEISSCSNFEDFQARRGNIRFRRETGSRPEFVHTLNGSGLAVGRTTAAILENLQEEDGSVTVPEVLRPYMGGLKTIEPRETLRVE